MRNLLYPLCLYLLCALCIWGEAQWWVKGLVSLPTLLWSTGWGWSLWLNRDQNTSPLQLLLDSAWISLIFAWLSVSLLRELGLGTSEQADWLLWGVSLTWCGVGLFLSIGHWNLSPLPPREKTGILAICLALLFTIWWKSPDIQRPLDGHWYLQGADDPRHKSVPLRGAKNWSSVTPIGWPEAGAQLLIPSSSAPDLVADGRVNGRITLAVRGPIGSYIEAKGVRNEVAESMSESEEEGPVRRYLDRGVAAISIWADLQPGEYLSLKVQGDEVYLLPSSEAVWALHATGALRYTFYYQILNQVENQVWAEEILQDRRFTWNQPPGWSPILALSNVMIVPDLHGAACLFLSVLTLVGLSALRLASVATPRAHAWAWSVPALLMIVHALLMFEPASHNFPDSLYAAALLSMLIGLLTNKPKRFATAAVLAQSLRWPGAILSTVFVLFWGWQHQASVRKHLSYLWAGVGIGVVISAGAMLSGDAEDLLFILYFETFPEHWHGNYNPVDLLSRLPHFFGKWTFYTGGMILLTVPFLFGSNIEHRKKLRVMLLGALAYGLLLGTIDHDPSHYFLPLVAITGPSFIAASCCIPNPNQQRWFLMIGFVGTLVYLWTGIV